MHVYHDVILLISGLVKNLRLETNLKDTCII